MVDVIKFSCSNCGQPFEADADMAGEEFSCPSCGWDGNIPNRVWRQTRPHATEVLQPPYKCRNGIKGVRIGVGILLLFVGLGVVFSDGSWGRGSRELIMAVMTHAGAFLGLNVGPDSKRVSESSPVVASVRCLLDYLTLPTERRLRELSASLRKCPTDFQESVKEYLIAITKTSEDVISARERDEMLKGKAFLGLLFGAVNQNDPRGGVAAGLQMGDVICAEVQEKAKRKLRQEIEYKTGRLVDVAKKYGIDANELEAVLLSR